MWAGMSSGPRVGVFVDGQRTRGMQTDQVGQARSQPAGPDLPIKGRGDVGEAFATGVEAELVQALAQHRREEARDCN